MLDASLAHAGAEGEWISTDAVPPAEELEERFAGHLARARKPVSEHGRRPRLGHRGAGARHPARRHLRRLPARARGVRTERPRERKAQSTRRRARRPPTSWSRRSPARSGGRNTWSPGARDPCGRPLRRRVRSGGLLLQLRPEPGVPAADGGVGPAGQRRRRRGRAAHRRARRPPVLPRDALLLPDAVTAGRAAPTRRRDSSTRRVSPAS